MLAEYFDGVVNVEFVVEIEIWVESETQETTFVTGGERRVYFVGYIEKGLKKAGTIL